MKSICLGNGSLILCSLFYLAWWGLAFKPGNKMNGIGTAALLLAASICGVAALVFTVMGTRSLMQSRTLVPNLVIFIGGILAYAILLGLTSMLLKRQVTSELFLILGWGVLELYMVNGVYGAELMSQGGALLCFLMIMVVAIISLICYVLYYKMGETAGYVDGMVPLLLVAIVMIILEISCIDIWKV